ncbi:MAG: hypothetical protein PUB49_00835 [Selenomonadaceae bacterium]|nr:hypothetical protein [Selenomonadaceae bacterium]
MEKKFMNKLDDMELDMVAGGAIKGSPSDSESAFAPLGRAMNKAVVKGVKVVAIPFKKGVELTSKLFDKIYKKVLPPQFG